MKVKQGPAGWKNQMGLNCCLAIWTTGAYYLIVSSRPEVKMQRVANQLNKKSRRKTKGKRVSHSEIKIKLGKRSRLGSILGGTKLKTSKTWFYKLPAAIFPIFLSEKNK